MTYSPVSGERVRLTYPDVTYTRLIWFLSIFILSYFIVRIYGSEINDSRVRIGLISTIFFSGGLGIFEGMFLLGQKFFEKKVEYDEENVYVTFGGAETVIPLTLITYFDRYPKMLQSLRGMYYGYSLETAGGEYPPVTKFSIYWKQKDILKDFRELLAIKNPDVKSGRLNISRWFR